MVDLMSFTIKKENIKKSEVIPKRPSKDFSSYMQTERARITEKINSRLPYNSKKLIEQYMFMIIKLDRTVDWQICNDDYFLECKRTAEKIWDGKSGLPDEYALGIEKTINAFKKIPNGKYIFNNFLEHLTNEHKNVSRRWKILPAKELDDIRIGVSEPWARSYSSMIFSNIEIHNIAKLASYGLPAKIADDLNDIEEDISLGFVNIPKEDMDKIEGIGINNDRIKKHTEKLKIGRSYIEKEISRAQNLYEEVDKHVDAIIEENQEDKNTVALIYLWKDFFHSWLKEAKIKYKL